MAVYEGTVVAEKPSSEGARKIIFGSVLLGLSFVAVVSWLFSDQSLESYSTFGSAAIGLYLAAIALILKPRTRLLHIGCTIMLYFAVLLPAITSPAQDVGDWPEYYLYLTSFINHGSPDQRREDELVYLEQTKREGMSDTLGLRFKSQSGRVYPYHFWLSSLAVSPVGLLLKSFDIPFLRAFAFINAFLIATAFYGILHWSRMGDLSSRVFAAFWIFSPVTWYIGWPSAEVWSASLVLMSIVLFTRKRFAGATLLAALAATQNPPILLYMGFVGSYGAAGMLKSHRLGAAALIAIAMLPAFLPNIFYLVTFGTSNLIVAQGEAGLDFLSAQRLTSFYFDLNQGIMPYAPLLIILWISAIVLAVRKRYWFGLALTITCLGMTLLSAMGGDWCSGCIGIIRWAVWQIPLIAWVIVDVFCPSQTIQRWSLVALGAGQGAMALLVLIWPAYVPDFLHHGPLAKYVLDTAPALYSPEPDIFFDRTMHYEVSNSSTNPKAIITHSVAYRNERGEFRKILMPEYLIGMTARAIGIPEETVRARMYPAGRGLYYLDML